MNSTLHLITPAVLFSLPAVVALYNGVCVQREKAGVTCHAPSQALPELCSLLVAAGAGPAVLELAGVKCDAAICTVAAVVGIRGRALSCAREQY